MAIIPASETPPQIDYLAKDAASFQRLMLDRLSALMPDWAERNPADLGQVLVEVLAYAADQLSYYQDAVANEAYLGTARRRVSVRRHARLLDYRMHDGCNARAWVTLQVDSRAEGQVLPKGTQFLSRAEGQPLLLQPAQILTLRSAGSQVFETLHDQPLRSRHSLILFYAAAGVTQLPVSATQATLDNTDSGGGSLSLSSGDVLLFEEVAGPDTGDPADADPSHRYAVRLTRADAGIDPVTGRSIVNIEWAPDDALPLALGLLTTVARGNVVLCDHGYTLPQPQALGTPQQLLSATGHYWPVLTQGPLTQQGAVPLAGALIPYDPQGPAQLISSFAMRDVQPAVVLRDGAGVVWSPRSNLLSSGRFATDFVVEVDNDQTFLRFGDGVFGKFPQSELYAAYRIGNGRTGNVGAEAISHLVDWLTPAGRDPSWLAGIGLVRNPLSAQGGTDPEAIDEVRMYAPQAFRVQERAITLDDYAAMARRHPQVRDAQATRRWTGSFYTIVLTVQRLASQPLDDDFRTALRTFLDGYRMVGQDLQIAAPAAVPLSIQLTIYVTAQAFRGAVRDLVAAALGSTQAGGSKGGFFYPDNFSLGQPIYLSQLISVAMQVPGVDWVEVDCFQRYGGSSELASGAINLTAMEVPQLDNDPSAPERGLLALTAQGGV